MEENQPQNQVPAPNYFLAIIKSPWFLLTLLILLIILGYVLVVSKKTSFESLKNQFITPDDQSINLEPTRAADAPTPTPFTVSFKYKIIEVTNTQLVLDGDRGKMRLNLNTNKLQVFIGSPDQNPTATDFSALKVGKSVSLTMIPNSKFWVYLDE